MTIKVPICLNTVIHEINERNLKINSNYQSLLMSFQVWTISQINDNNLTFELIKSVNNQRSLKIFQDRDVNIKSLKEYQEIINNEYFKSQGLLQAIKIYEESLSNLAIKQNLIHRKLKKQRKCSDENTSSRYIFEIQEIQASIENLLKDITEIENNLINEHQELQKFNDGKLSELILGLVTCQNNYYQSSLIQWRNIKELIL